jgi:membrane associated rhomboid family serine protease
MLLLDIVLLLFLAIVTLVQLVFFWLPIGNESSIVRRLPFITFGIIGLNVLIFFATLPALHHEETQLVEEYQEIQYILERNPELLYDAKVKEKLIEAHIATEEELAAYDSAVAGQRDESVTPSFLEEMERQQQRAALEARLDSFKNIRESGVFYSFGISPNGNWKVHQLVTHMFLHVNFIHLLGNVFFFFAVGFNLEDFWGRGLFTAFYFAGGLVACLPQLIFPESVPAVGASGAVSAVMGAFLVRLPKTKIRIGWVFTPYLFGYLIWMRGRRFFEIVSLLLSFKLWEATKTAIVYLTIAPYVDTYNLITRRPLNIPAYVFLPYYFMVQVASLWVEKRSGSASGVAFSVHIAGFAFGALFAYALKSAKVEERYIHPHIEQKISFTASTTLSDSLELMDRGDVLNAERKLQGQLSKNPQDISALMALGQVYQKTGNFEQLNSTYARLIRCYLAQGDKEAALYAYDALLSAFPDNAVNPRIFVRDWLTICEHLREMGMVREASVEFERIVHAYPDDPLAIRACLQGGEAALTVNDKERALSLFERARLMNPQGSYQIRLERGLASCGRANT